MIKLIILFDFLLFNITYNNIKFLFSILPGIHAGVIFYYDFYKFYNYVIIRIYKFFYFYEIYNYTIKRIYKFFFIFSVRSGFLYKLREGGKI